MKKDRHRPSLRLRLLGNCDAFLKKKRRSISQTRLEMLNVEIVNPVTQKNRLCLLKKPVSGWIYALNYAAAECDI